MQVFSSAGGKISGILKLLQSDNGEKIYEKKCREHPQVCVDVSLLVNQSGQGKIAQSNANASKVVKFEKKKKMLNCLKKKILIV